MDLTSLMNDSNDAEPFDPFKAGAIALDDFDPFKAGAIRLDVPEATSRTAGGKTDRLPAKAPAANPAPDPLEDPENASLLDDILRSTGAGLRRGVEGVFGMIGDVNASQGDAASWALRALGVPVETANHLGGYARYISTNPMAPTTGEIRSLTDRAFGESYEPQTTAGEYARTVGEFAPNAAMPGGVARRAAMVAVPALLSETAGQATEGTAAEPYARVAGALAGGLAAAGRAPGTLKTAAKGAPTQTELKGQADRLYGLMRRAGIKYDANAFAGAVQDMADDLHKTGFRPSVARDAFGLVDDLAKEVGRSPDFDDINGLVQMVGQKARAAAATGDQTSAAAFNIIRDKLMTLESRAPLISQTPFPQQDFNRIRAAAREVAKRNIKARMLSEIVENADTYAGGREAGIRNQIRSLVRSKRGKQIFSAEEKNALLQVANGRKALQTLSRFGFDLTKVSGNASFIPTIGAIGAGGVFGPPTGIALAGAGTAAKFLSPRLTEQAFEQAAAGIRSGRLRDPTVLTTVKAERLKTNIRRMVSPYPAAERFGGETDGNPSGTSGL